MPTDTLEDEREIKRQVREFYDRVGWKEVSDGLYQNARYEDLRPVTQEYIHRCHLRIGRHLLPSGRLFLDAGSGPIQYPEYLEYSHGYAKRICADISIIALKAARERIGEQGAFVVSDIVHLPFQTDSFDAVLSLHTIHHLPVGQQVKAYVELYRVLAKGALGVVVNGWDYSPLNAFFEGIKTYIKATRSFLKMRNTTPNALTLEKGTFIRKKNPAWLKRELNKYFAIKILVWRSAGTNFLRFFIRERWCGRFWLRLLYFLEELFPHYLGERGRYPMIIFRK
jgi:ubiquinone/menaquinone biosynthesis C-methylase UbiE